jgi:2-methylcitrate dehydratase PrpD
VTDSTTAELAKLLTELAGSVSAQGEKAAKGRLLHAVRLSLVNADVPTAVTAWKAVAGDTGDCLALGFPHGLSPMAACFANAVSGYSSLQEDTGFLRPMHGGGHPGTYVVPAALAAAEASDASGERLLAGIVVGYEAVDRVFAASPVGRMQQLFTAVPLLGPFGAAAAAATVFGCDAAALDAALAIAANAGGGVKQGTVDGTMEFYFSAGFAARDGLLAAELALSGALTSSASLDGPFGFFQTFGNAPGDLDQLLAPTDEPAVCRIGTKRFPSCLQNQETIALVTRSLPPDIVGSAIDRVTVHRSHAQRNGITVTGVDSRGPYQTPLQAQMAARFTTAAALLRRPVEDIHYFLDAPHDSEAIALADRIELVTSDDDDVRLELDLVDGRSVELHGDTSQVLFPTTSEIRERFLASTGPVLGPAAAEQAADLIDRLESLPTIRQLTALLRGSEGDEE